MSLPNNNQDQIKVFPNEYITNTTVNRPNLRLLENDQYLDGLLVGLSGESTSGLASDISNLSSAIDSNSTDITYLSGQIDAISALTYVDAPSGPSAIGHNYEVAVSAGYVYFYSVSGGSNWGRVALDYSW